MFHLAKHARADGPTGPTGTPPPPGDIDEALWRGAAAVLGANWTGTYTVPSRTLYPHQWSWDAGFISVGLAHVAPDRAWRDLRSLFEAQWPDGRVPHIVFDPDVTERDYFPGPTFWGGGGTTPYPGAPPTGADGVPARRSTGIVQPPVHALGAWLICQRAPGEAAVAELRWLYPRLVAQQEYLATARDVGGAGLSAIVHPWESGLDNSPAWDEALANVPVDLAVLHRYSRRDTLVVASDHRPTDEDYARYLAIALSYRDRGYRDADLAGRHPFLVECPGFNALRGAAELALARIAEVVGADPAAHLARAAGITRALVDRLFDPETGMFHVRDLRTGRRSPARCVNGLLPLVLPDLPEPQVSGLVAAITSPRFGVSARMPVPSYDRTATDFDPYRYWRGPVWFNINWLLWRGLRTHRQETLAGTLRTALLDLVRDSGYYEYFHPDSGAGIGSPAFSWTAALTLDLLAAPDDPG
ncbi:MGH1-like glycoside hydrolase domain-containing protein [Plantactinospora sonchi]|uniref:Mannosylglycerate hydrolase MGH1-like glycoside hydrolase domain-containing protein n=1 Tax=Plantactinospora sonchi TaxID=1544735 RepID=A0ABU7RN60_9ACTN